MIYYRIFTMNKITARINRPYVNEEELAHLAKALGHPVRVKIITFLLSQKECFCGEICKEIPLAQSTVSQHLKVLKKAGFIKGEVEGPRVCYCVDTSRLEILRLLLQGVLEISRTNSLLHCNGEKGDS